MPFRPGELKLGATLFHNVCDDISLLWSTVISLPCEVSTEALISDLELTRVSVDRFTAETTVEVDVSSQATDGASRAVGTHHGPTRIHVPTGAYAIGGTATLAQRCSIISATAAARTLPPG